MHKLLLGSLFLSFITKACPPEFEGRPLSFEYQLTETQKSGFISQPLHDYIFTLSGVETSPFDSPAPPYLEDFVDVSESPQSKLCAYRKYVSEKGKPPGVETLEFLPISDPSIASTLNKANRLWQANTKQDKLAAAALYTHVSRQLSPFPRLASIVGMMALNAHFFLFDYNASLSLIQSLKSNSQLSAEKKVRIGFTLAEIQLRQGKAQEGLATLSDINSQHFALLNAPQNLNLIVEYLSLLGEGHLMANEIEPAKQALTLGDKLATQSSDQHILNNAILATLYDNFGYLHLKQSEDNSADRPEQLLLALKAEYKGLSYAHKTGDIAKQVVILNNVAWMHKSRFSLNSARRSYLISLALLQDFPDKEREALIYRNLGKVYLSIGLYKRAAVYLSHAQQLAREAIPVWAARFDCQLAETYRYLEDYTRAQFHVDRCSTFFQTKQALETDYLYALTEKLEVSNITATNSDETLVAAQLLAQRVDYITNREIQAKAFKTLAQIELDAKNPTAALRLIDKAIEAANLSADPTLITKMNATATSMALASGNPLLAEKYAARAIDHITQTMQKIDPVELGPAWSDLVDDFYSMWISHQLSLDDPHSPEKSLAISEHIRGSNLYRARDLMLGADVQETEFEKLTRISELTSSLITPKDIKDHNKQLALIIEKDLLGVSTHVNNQNLIKNEIVHFESLKGSSLAPSYLTEKTDHNLAPGLRPNQLALYYHVDKNHTGVFVVTEQSVGYYSLSTTEELHTAVKNTLYLLASRDAKAPAKLRDLSKLLLPESLPMADIVSLFVIPHKFLNGIPFSALTYVDNGHSPIVLGQEMNIINVPTLATIKSHNHANQTLNEPSITVIADPFLNNASQKRQKDNNRAWASELAPLPWSEREADWLGELFGAEKAVVFKRKQATRKNLLSVNARNANILHIATHGFYNEKTPGHVGFTLALETETGEQDPGFVSFAELRTHAFLNQLVVINGCETALGETASGEGFLSMARGFMASGAENVIATLWPVSDRASAKFMEYFYTHLVKTGDIAASLTFARIQMQNNPRFRHPFYWAGYTHYSVG